jgi:AmmeMemoRadiSam system protein B
MKARMPAVAGAFYPSSAKDLTRELSFLFEKTKVDVKPSVAALIVPHAGYIYSGKVAAAAYSRLEREKQYQNVFIIGPSHQKYFSGVSIYPKGSYLSPLGEVTINEDTASELIEKNKFIYYDLEADVGEHCLEVQLPFLQFYLKKEFKIVPLILGSDDPALCRHLADALEPWFNSENLFIISSDFSHYPTYENAVPFDSETAQAIIANDVELLKRHCDNRKRNFPINTQTALCGFAAVQTLLYLTQDMNVTYEKILYQNSGDSLHGNKARVVGYWSKSVNWNPQAN